MVVPCKEEQRSQAAHQACNRARSGLTHWVTVVESAYPKLCKAFKIIESDQLRFLGSWLAPSGEHEMRTGFVSGELEPGAVGLGEFTRNV